MFSCASCSDAFGLFGSQTSPVASPAALSRQILALTGQLETLAQAKKAPRPRPPVNHGFNPTFSWTY